LNRTQPEFSSPWEKPAATEAQLAHGQADAHGLTGTISGKDAAFSYGEMEIKELRAGLDCKDGVPL
jgi:hypothetical protein